MLTKVHRFMGALVALILVSFCMVESAAAQATDIVGVTSAVSGYVNPAIAVAVAVLLFVLGRRIVRKLIS